ncbi:MAG: type II toxin-antitoxin system VapC family toxin [Rhodocyclaceae bacterium]
MIYLDTSFITPLFRAEALSGAVEACLARQPVGTLAISQWTRLEFSGVMARDVRMGALPSRDALLALEAFDAFVEGSLHVFPPAAADYRLADRFVREFATQLRAADALHLAIAHNQAIDEVFTLDQGMLRAARRLKIKAGRKIRISP